MEMTVKDAIQAALQCKELLEEEKRKYEKRIEPLKTVLHKAELWLLKYLNEQGLQNAAVKGVGTAFKRKVTSVSVADWAMTFEWMQNNNRFDLLNHSVNKTSVTAFVEETGNPPPGVNYTSDIEISINRARAKVEDEDKA